jgi:hypothetical protein
MLPISVSDNSTTVMNPNASSRLGFGDIDGASFSFGGINDKGSPWPWVAGFAVIAFVAFLWFRYRKSP